MPITTRPAVPADAAQMTELLNEIITIGGTTAHQRPFDTDRMLHHYIQPDHHLSTIVAELDGATVGFQMLVWPNPAEGPMPEHWGFIGSFVKVGITGQGIGPPVPPPTPPVVGISMRQSGPITPADCGFTLRWGSPTTISSGPPHYATGGWSIGSESGSICHKPSPSFFCS